MIRDSNRLQENMYTTRSLGALWALTPRSNGPLKNNSLILGRCQVFLDATYAVYMWFLVDLLHLSKGELKNKFDLFDICVEDFILLCRSSVLCHQVQRYLNALCPNGNMSMMGKYRRNAITFKETVM